MYSCLQVLRPRRLLFWLPSLLYVLEPLASFYGYSTLVELGADAMVFALGREGSFIVKFWWP